MPISRRDLLAAAALAPAGFLAGTAAATLGRIARRGAAAVRPGPVGTTASVCAACGTEGHTMLDARCPATRRVL
ncbi:MAG TPA: hypothetical protein VFO73_01975 [Candidatus Limnocylindrales bacterium]|nr:hypothetical protein [Candidatus Limnocylindrales bacterium]